MFLRLAKYRMSPPHPTRTVSRKGQLATRGLTLIEMLIGMAITLVMMAAVVTLFANIGAGIRVQRAAMEMSSQLRITRARLFLDLAGATCAPRPKLPTDDHDDGYIEIIEGQWSDSQPSLLLTGGGTAGVDRLDYALSQVPSGGDPSIVFPSTSTRTVASNDVTNGGGLGDYDDILALTVRSESEPFVGRWFNTNTNRSETIESNLAEVIWYAVENPADGSLGEPGMRTIFRRVLLIAPWVQGDLQLPGAGSSAVELLNFYRENDISIRLDSSGATATWIPNTLSDLVKRENRFGHFLDNVGGLGFPFAINRAAIRASAYDPAAPPSDIIGPFRPFGSPFDTDVASQQRQGEDIMLNHVLAFDLRVYDDGAPIFQGPTATIVLEPSDAGWLRTSPVGFGTFVDLGWSAGYFPPVGEPKVRFEEPRRIGWHPKNTAGFVQFPAVYDTGSYHYENDGLDQDDTTGDDNVQDSDPLTGAIDEGTNGLDDDGINGVDDVGERETSPPYDVPLRGIQVKLRVYEPDTRQIREATITRGLVPQ